MIIYLVFKKQ